MGRLPGSNPHYGPAQRLHVEVVAHLHLVPLLLLCAQRVHVETVLDRELLAHQRNVAAGVRNRECVKSLAECHGWHPPDVLWPTPNGKGWEGGANASSRSESTIWPIVLPLVGWG